MTDPVIEHVAMSLAYCERPVLVAPVSVQDERDAMICYWRALSAQRQRIYRYRADVAIAAYQRCEEVRDAAAE